MKQSDCCRIGPFDYFYPTLKYIYSILSCLQFKSLEALEVQTCNVCMDTYYTQTLNIPKKELNYGCLREQLT